MVSQTNYDRVDADIGQIARAHPFLLSYGKTQVDANERMPRPGDAVIWDSTANAFKIPESAEVPNAVGIVVLDGGKVPTRIGSTTNTAIQYADGDDISVMVSGVVYVRVNTGASETINWGSRLVWNPPTSITEQSDWEELASTVRGPSTATATSASAVVNGLLGVQVVAFNTTPVGNSTDTIIAVRVNL